MKDLETFDEIKQTLLPTKINMPEPYPIENIPPEDKRMGSLSPVAPIFEDRAQTTQNDTHKNPGLKTSPEKQTSIVPTYTTTKAVRIIGGPVPSRIGKRNIEAEATETRNKKGNFGT